MNTESRSNINTFLPYGFVLLQGLLYGFGDPISKAAYETMPVYSLLTVRYTIAFLFLLIIGRKGFFKEVRRTNITVWILPSICIGLAYVVGNIALVLTEATSVAFLRQLATVFTPILAFMFYRKAYGWRHVPVQIAVIAGLYLMCGLGGLSGFGLGEIAALVAAVTAAGALVFGEKALESMSVVTLTTLQCGVSALMALILAIADEGGVHMGAATPKIWLIIVYLAILCTVAGYFLQNAAMRSISSSSVALLQCFCPVMTAMFSLAILGEKLNFVGIIGAFIILACCAIETVFPRNS